MDLKHLTIEIKKTAAYKKGTEMLMLLDTLKEAYLPVPIRIAENEKLGKIEFFAEELKKENGIGFLAAEQENVEAAIKNLLSEEIPYQLFLKGHKGNVMKAELSWEEVVKAEVEVDTEAFADLKKHILDHHFCTEEELERNIRVMKAHRCNDEMIRQVLSTYRHYDRPANVPGTIYVDPDPESKKASLFSDCLLNTLIGAATIYEGDKSVGKNMCAETVAMVRNQPYYMISFNRSMTADDVYGSKSTDNSASRLLTPEMAESYLEVMNGTVNPEAYKAAAEFEYLKAKAASVAIVQEQSCLVEWLRNGGVMCFNEMNMAEANFFSSFANQITDGSGFLDIPGYGRITINPDCILIGTQNADYTGVCEQNDATLSRFGCIQFDYPKSIEKQLKAVVGEDRLDQRYFSQTDQFYQSLLAAVHNGQVENSCLNIRGFCRALNATAQVPGATTLADQIRIHVINTCPIDDRIPLTAQLNEKITL
ncbi:MAG: hypothetical protein ACI4D3_12180 [Lachnospiraceae bacterium]